MNRLVSALEDIEADLDELEEFIEWWRAVSDQNSSLARSWCAQPAGTKYRGTLSNTAKVRASIAKAMEVAERRKAAAERQRKTGFGYLYQLAVVRLWSALEATMMDLCLARLGHDGYWNSARALGGIKVDLGFFLPKPIDEQIAFILENSATRDAARKDPGAARFEAILNALELGGAVPPPVSKRLVCPVSQRC